MVEERIMLLLLLNNVVSKINVHEENLTVVFVKDFHYFFQRTVLG